MLQVRPDDVVNEARKYIGSPYRHRGTSKTGIDCIGVVWRVAFDLGLTNIILPEYSNEPSSEYMSRHLGEELERIDKRDSFQGDVFAFRFAKFTQHVGIYTGRNIIHSYQQIGGCREHIMSDKWRRLHIATYRFRYFL